MKLEVDKMLKLKRILAVICTISSIGFGIAGFIVPPTGIISSSVLWFTAQLFVFAATLLGIDIELVKLLKKVS